MASPPRVPCQPLTSHSALHPRVNPTTLHMRCDTPLTFAALALLLCLCYAPLAHAQCRFVKSSIAYWAGPPSAVRACFETLPLTASHKSTTLAAVRASLEYYSFGDFIRAPQGDYPSAVDWPTELNTITNTAYRYEFQFHAALSALFVKLRDAHTQYMAPKGYGNFFVASSLALEPRVVSGVTKYFATAGFLPPRIYRSLCNCGVELSSYYGKEVVEIEGIPIADYLASRAPLDGMYHDLSVLANNFLSISFGSSQMLFTRDLPMEDEFTMRFAGSSSANSFKWTALAQVDINSADDIYSLNAPSIQKRDGSLGDLEHDLLSRLTSLQASFKRGYLDISERNYEKLSSMIAFLEAQETDPTILNHVRLADISRAQSLLMDLTSGFDRDQIDMETKEKIDARVAEMEAEMDRSVSRHKRAETSNTIEKAIVSGSGNALTIHEWQSYAQYLKYGGTSILRLSSFDSGTTEAGISNFKALITRVFTERDANGANQNLIIDVTRNGGGYICMLMSTLSYIVDAWADKAKYVGDDVMYTPYDVRVSSLTEALYKNPGDLLDTYWARDPVSGEKLGRAHYTQLEERTYGMATSRYTRKYHWDICTTSPRNWWFSPKARAFDKIIIVTDGRCGSACAYFVNQLRQNNKVRIVTYGGLDGYPMASSSFEGGNVLTWPEVVGLVSSTPRLPDSAYLSFNFRQTFSSGSTIPREFVRRKGDWHLRTWAALKVNRMTTPGDVEKDALATLYASVLPLFNEMPSGLPSAQFSPPPPAPIAPHPPTTPPTTPVVAPPQETSPLPNSPPQTDSPQSPGNPSHQPPANTPGPDSPVCTPPCGNSDGGHVEPTNGTQMSSSAASTFKIDSLLIACSLSALFALLGTNWV